MKLFIRILQSAPSLAVGDAIVQTKSLRADALLLYLGLTPEPSHGRENLACLLWEDSDTAKSLGSLRQLVRRIRSSSGEIDEIIRFDRDAVRVDHDRITVDLDTFCEALTTDTPPGDLQVSLDELFAGFSGISSALDSWIAVMRNRVETRLRDALADVYENAAAARDNRLHAARNMMQLDQTCEPACRVLMESHAKAGDTAAALRVYNDLYARLDEDYDIEPAEETQALVARIKMGDIPVERAPPAKATTSAPARPRGETIPQIHVSDFDLSTDLPRMEMLARVFRQELLVNLSTFREWRLFDAEPVVQDGYRLEGLVGDEGDRLTFIATLKLKPDNRIIWSERFHVGFDTWGQVQWNIAKRISVAINAGVSADRLNRCLSATLEDRTTFDQWVLAQSYILAWEADKIDAATTLLDEVLTQAPRYGPAHASRAFVETVRHLNMPGVFRAQDRLRLGYDHAKKALEIDPIDTRAHLALAWNLAMTGQHQASLLHFENCLELNPNSVLGRLSCALGFAFADELPRACALVDETLGVVRPLTPFLWGYVQNIWFLDHQIDRALEAGRQAGAAIINLPAWQAAAAWEAQDPATARASAAEFVRLARAQWQSDLPCTAESALRWLTSCFPFKNPQHTQRLYDGVHAALAAGDLDATG